MTSDFIDAQSQYEQPNPPRLYPRGLEAQYVRWIQSTETYLQRLEMDLRGLAMVKNEDGTTEIIRYQEPMLNEAGIRSVLTQLRPILSPNLYMSDISKDRVYDLIGENMLDIHDLLTFNRKEFNIKSLHDIDEILTIIGNYVEPAFLRARGGAERNVVSQMNPEHDQKNVTPGGGGFFNTLWNFKR